MYIYKKKLEMNIIDKILNGITVTFSIIYSHFKTVDNYVVKSDDDSFEILMKSEQNKAKFQNEVDKLISENKGSRKIEINNKHITISI